MRMARAPDAANAGFDPVRLSPKFSNQIEVPGFILSE
jgi:hypothetical protein